MKEYIPENSIQMIGSVNKVIATALVFMLSLSNATLTLAQSSPDTRSPVIELEAVAESQADAIQVFTAQVVDDRILKDVTLYFRREGQQSFSPTPMTSIANSAYFSASITTDPTDLRAIQYYVQARDEGGNRTVQGYAFDPYTRVLTGNEALAEAAITPPVVTPTEAVVSGNGIRWWQIALGVLLAGTVASVVASSGGDDASDDGSVPLTVTITGI